LLSKLVSDCLSISPLQSDGWLAAALHWKHDLVRMSELLEKVTASDPQCVHAHLLEAELHLERRQYAAALFSARNAHALHRSVRSYRFPHQRPRFTVTCIDMLRQRSCEDVSRAEPQQGCSCRRKGRTDNMLYAVHTCQPLTLAPLLNFKQELMESQPRSARALVVMVRWAAVAAAENCNIRM
jgi:hypothetical protein